MTRAERLAVPGFRAASAACGIKKGGKADVALVASDLPCVSDVVFTRNRVAAAPVLWGRALRSRGSLRGVLANSGNANACTGAAGLAEVRRTSEAACRALGLAPGALLISSTGVIGVPLPPGRIAAAVPSLCAALSEDGLARAAEAIMTTDAFPKYGVRRIWVGGKMVTLAAIAKGAGMIAPNMGTMLAFAFTDAALRPADLRRLFREAVEFTFNRLVVDGDTSTNDTAALFANGACGLAPLSGKALSDFGAALHDLFLSLALMIVRDGEGATRVVRVTVRGAKTDREAERAARAVATSPLVKTAVFGADVNWGRVVAAVGRSGARFAPEAVTVSFAGERILRRGLRPDRAAERRAAAKIRAAAYDIDVDLGAGRGRHFLYFSDLTHDYVRINAGYRT